MKVKLWNGFGVKWSSSKTGLQNFTVSCTKSKPQIVSNGWQKSEISRKIKENIILSLFKWLKKPYKWIFVERKILLKSVALNIVSETKPLSIILQNKNALRLIRKLLRKHHAEKLNFFFSCPRRAVFPTNGFLLVLK